MEDGNINDHDKDTTIAKPNKTQRHILINRLIKENPQLKTIGQLINRLNITIKDEFPDYQYDMKGHQPLITGDLKELGIKTTGGKGFKFTDYAVKKEQVTEILKIIDLANMSVGNIIDKAFPMAIKIDGYGQALARVLKKMYPNGIIDILVLESSIIIFCIPNAFKGIQKDLKDVANGKIHNIIHRDNSKNKINKPPIDENSQ